MSIADAAKAITARLRAEGHHLADDAHQLWDALCGDDTAVAEDTDAAAQSQSPTAQV